MLMKKKIQLREEKVLLMKKENQLQEEELLLLNKELPPQPSAGMYKSIANKIKF